MVSKAFSTNRMCKPLKDGAALVDARILLSTIADQPVLIHLLDPFVNNSTRPCISHVRENCILVSKVSRWDCVALRILSVRLPVVLQQHEV